MEIKRLDNQGRGIGFEDDKTIFVNGALPGEDVTYKKNVEKSKYCVADIESILKESNVRVVPKCKYYNQCGGCNLMHMGIEYQEDFKLEKVYDILRRQADVRHMPIRLIKNNQELFYRNKVTLKVVNNGFGYYDSNSHSFINIDQCLLATRCINEIISNHDFINILDGEIVIRSNYNNEILIHIRSDKKVILMDNIPSNIVGIVLNDKTIYKDNYFYDYIGDYKFRVSYDSFFQVNNYIANEIFSILKNNLSGENLLDLYCGVGTLGISVADRFKNIYGIELVENAIEDAKINAKNNNVDNAHYYAGDTSEILKELNVRFDAVILDPPRSGLNKQTLKYIEEIDPEVIVYVSCDPMTLGRDLKILKNRYSIEKMNSLDMFPNTYHVECVSVLRRLENN